jgi:hypothetical protein
MGSYHLQLCAISYYNEYIGYHGAEHMGPGIPSTGMVGVATGADQTLRLNIERYEALLKGNLGPKARKMFEVLLAQARADLAAG